MGSSSFSTNTYSCESYGAHPYNSGQKNTQFIQDALDAAHNSVAAGGTVTLFTPGTYTLAHPNVKTTSDGNTYRVALIIYSNISLILGPGVILKGASGITNAVLIQNSDITSGNTNIDISGGKWDGNFGNITNSYVDNGGVGAWCQISMWFQNITNFRLHDLWMADPQGWGIGINKLDGFSLYNIWRIDTQATRTASSNQDGIDIVGQNANGEIRNIYSNSMDDVIAFLQDQGTIHTSGLINAMGGYGSCINVLVDGVHMRASDGAWNAVRLLDSTANSLQNITVRNITGLYIDSAVKLGSSSAPGITSLLRNILIDNVTASAFIIAPSAATIQISGNAESVTLRNLRRRNAASETAKPLVHIVTVLLTPAIESLTIDDAIVINLNTTSTSWVFVENGSVDHLNVNNVRVKNAVVTTGTGNLLFVPTGSTVTNLRLTNSTAFYVQRLIALDGTVTNALVEGNVYYGPTAPTVEAIRIRGTVPNLKLRSNDINMANGGSGTSAGVINFNASTGTTFIEASGNAFSNGANVNLARAASEAIRWDGIDVAVPSNILTAAAGDVLRDSTASNAPVRCSTAPSTFTAL